MAKQLSTLNPLALKFRATKLKIELFFFGLATFFVGLYPFLGRRGYLPEALAFLPLEGTWYTVIVLVIGGAALFLSVRQ